MIASLYHNSPYFSRTDIFFAPAEPHLDIKTAAPMNKSSKVRLGYSVMDSAYAFFLAVTALITNRVPIIRTIAIGSAMSQLWMNAAMM